MTSHQSLRSDKRNRGHQIRSRSLLTAMAIPAALAIASAPALAAPGNGNATGKPVTPPGNSGNNPHGGPPGITQAPAPAANPGGSSRVQPAGNPAPQGRATGRPTTPPGNSGNNPHGGPPGITGSGAPGQAPSTTPAPVAAPTPNTPNGPDGKITICHSTGSESNPYVEITISVNGLNGHSGHHDGADIVPAPAGGCPGTAAAAPDPQRSTRSTDDPREPASRDADRETRGVAAAAGDGSGPDDPAELAAAPLDTADEAEPASSDEGPLAFTGLSLYWLLAIGAGLVALGLLLRGRSRAVA